MKNKIFEKMKEYGWNLGDNTNKINEQIFQDMISFMNDFLRALNDIDYNTNIKLDLISHYIKSRNISSDQIGQDILAIIENEEEGLEELKENNTKQIDYINKRVDVCGWNKSDMYELDCLNYENEQIDKLLEEI